jgi:hypothetical protein
MTEQQQHEAAAAAAAPEPLMLAALPAAPAAPAAADELALIPAAAAPEGLQQQQQQLVAGPIKFTWYLEGGRRWFVSRQLSAAASKEVVLAIKKEVDGLWLPVMPQLHANRFLFLSIAPIEQRKNKQHHTVYTRHGHFVLLGGSAPGVQLKQQLGHVDDAFDVEQHGLLRVMFKQLVNAKASNEDAEQVMFELQHPQPLFKLSSAFDVSVKQPGGQMQQREQSSGCSIEAPCHGSLSAGIRAFTFQMKMMLGLKCKLQGVDPATLPAELQQLLLRLPDPVEPLTP